MVQIPEYTRRENAQPMQRGGVNFNLPGVLTQPTGMGEAGQKALKISSELADVYVGMKERRDDGIVSAFMNQYDKDSTQKLIELRERYRGQEAKKVMPEFQKWRDSYIAEHSSYDPDSAKEGVVYLEDAAQNRIAKQKLDSYNVRDINSISAYIAQEEENFRVNNLKASISSNSEKVVNENFSQNAAILKAEIANDVSSLYRGQSALFIKNATDDVLDAALYGNVMRDSASNPIASISRFQDKNFSKEMKSDTKEKARKQITQAFINYQAQQLANADTGRPSSPAGEEFYRVNADFFKGNLNSVKSQIEDKAIELRNSILEEDRQNNIANLNDLTIQVLDSRERIGNATDFEEKQKYLSVEATALSALTGVRGGVETAKMIENVFVEVNDYDWLANVEEEYRSGKSGLIISGGRVVPSEQEVKRRMDEYREKAVKGSETIKQAVHNINIGKYETLLDIPDFESYSPHQKKELMKAFSDKARYESLNKTARDKSGIDFDYQIDKIYKFERGEPWRNPVEYNNFKKEMSQKIVSWLSVNPNKIPEAKDLQIMANNSMQSQTDSSAYDSLVAQIRGLDFSDDRHRDYSTTKKELVQKLKSGSNALTNWFYSKEEEEVFDRAADYILDGDKISGYNLLREAKLYD